MGVFLPYVIASVVVSWIFGRVYDQLTAGMSGGLVTAGRVGIFVVTWPAVSVMAGMHGFTKRVRQLRQGTAEAEARLEALTKGDGR